MERGNHPLFTLIICLLVVLYVGGFINWLTEEE